MWSRQWIGRASPLRSAKICSARITRLRSSVGMSAAHTESSVTSMLGPAAPGRSQKSRRSKSDTAWKSDASSWYPSSRRRRIRRKRLTFAGESSESAGADGITSEPSASSEAKRLRARGDAAWRRGAGSW